MLPRAGFGNDALGAEAFCQQRLSHRVVDLVCAGVREVLALQPNLGTPTLAQTGRERKRSGAAHPSLQFMGVLGLKVLAMQISVDPRLQAIESRYQRFGYITPAEGTVAPLL